VRAAGEVNFATRVRWETTLAALPGTGDLVVAVPEVHLELAGLVCVDAGGAAAVAAMAERLAPDGRVVLHQPPRALPRILEVLWPRLTGIEVWEA
jgi:ABC-type transporter Mla MlaB component